MRLARWLQINGLLWSVLGTFGIGYISAQAFAVTLHWWDGLLAGGALILAVASVTTMLYALVAFVEAAAE